MSRFRIRSEHHPLYWSLLADGNQVVNSASGELAREDMQDSNNLNLRPYSGISHAKVRRHATVTYRYPHPDALTERYIMYGATSDVHKFGSYVISNLGEFMQPPKMEFQKNNSFELLSFLGEIDDTLAMFSAKFLKSLTRRRIVGNKVKVSGVSGSAYGAYTWGVVPLLNDLQGLLRSAQDIFGGGLAKSLEDAKDSAVIAPVNKEVDYYDWGGSRVKGRVFGTLRLTGGFHLPDLAPLDYLMILLDELGVHPDLKTAWDLTPMSFVADYFLPIGDLLDQLHPRGWFKPVITYDGKISAKLTTVNYVTSTYDSNSVIAEVVGSYYYRGNIAYDFIPQPSKPLKFNWKAPSMRELFNTAYVALSK